MSFTGTEGVSYGLSEMNFLGVSCNNHEYPYGNTANWRRDSNGNSEDVLHVVKELFPDDEILFVIERDFNRNILVYKTAFDENDELDLSKIVDVFWLMVDAPVSPTNLGRVHIEELSILERSLAYGVEANKDEIGYYIKIRALNEPIRVFYEADELHAGLAVKGNMMTLERVMIYTTPRALCWPLTTQLDFNFMDGETKSKCTYHYSPK